MLHGAVLVADCDLSVHAMLPSLTVAMDELVATEFFGFPPDKFYHEVYAIGYNEFLTAVSSLRDVLIKEFPEKQEEVDEGCSTLLASYSKQFDQKWFAKFLQYCSKNIFVVPRQVPMYPKDMDVEGNQEALARVDELRHFTMATEYLNSHLEAHVSAMDEEIKKRRDLLQWARVVESRLKGVERARELEEQLRQLAGKLFGSDSQEQLET